MKLNIVRNWIFVSGIFAVLPLSSVIAEHSWNTFHWASSVPVVPLTIVDSVTSDRQNIFETAVDAWNLSSVINMTIVQGDESVSSRKRCSAPNGQIRVCNYPYGTTGWLGWAFITVDANGHIKSGSAKLNESYSDFFAATPGEALHVVCQEIGHTLGLAHTSEDGTSQGTCMDYSNDPASTLPNDHDYELLAQIYSHLESYDSFSGGSSGGGGGGDPKPCRGNNCSSMFDGNELGELLRSSDRNEVYIRPTSDGGLVVTHVRLAP